MKITIQYDSGQYDVIESNTYEELKARAIAMGLIAIPTYRKE